MPRRRLQLASAAQSEASSQTTGPAPPAGRSPLARKQKLSTDVHRNAGSRACPFQGTEYSLRRTKVRSTYRTKYGVRVQQHRPQLTGAYCRYTYECRVRSQLRGMQHPIKISLLAPGNSTVSESPSGSTHPSVPSVPSYDRNISLGSAPSSSPLELLSRETKPTRAREAPPGIVTDLLQ